MTDAELGAIVAQRTGYAVRDQRTGGGGTSSAPLTDVPPSRAPLPCERQATLLELRSLSFTLPIPPSNNELYGHNPKTGQKYLLDEQRRFRSVVIGMVRFEMKRAPPLLGRIEASVRFYFANRRRIDIRNLVKALDDALVHAKAMRDDSQIDAAHEYRHLIADGSDERTEVTLQEIA